RCTRSIGAAVGARPLDTFGGDVFNSAGRRRLLGVAGGLTPTWTRRPPDGVWRAGGPAPERVRELDAIPRRRAGSAAAPGVAAGGQRAGGTGRRRRRDLVWTAIPGPPHGQRSGLRHE